MPKNWGGENSKSAQAKARKDAVRRDENEKKQKEAEDKYWEDNDKHVLRKQERKLEAEKKQAEKLQKKEETQKLLEEELKTLKSAKPERVEKVTKYDIDLRKEKEEFEKAKDSLNQAKKASEILEPEIEINPNRIEIEGEIARDVTEAIKILNTNGQETVDLHPEKRLRAAYLEYEEENLERLKKENPNMRLSQIKQLLWKEWQKSPKNPINKIFLG